MKIFHDRLNAHWYEFHTDVLYYINSKNNRSYSSGQMLNAITEQAIHIVTNGDSKHWYLVANYDLLDPTTKNYIINDSNINKSFITFNSLSSIMEVSLDFYSYFSIPVDVETVIDTLLTNYSTQVELLKKGISNGNYIPGS